MVADNGESRATREVPDTGNSVESESDRIKRKFYFSDVRMASLMHTLPCVICPF